MIDYPKTKEEAAKYRYHQWSGNPNGHKYIEYRCAEEVWSSGRGSLPYQCSRKNGHGPDGIYCKQHAKGKVEA